MPHNFGEALRTGRHYVTFPYIEAHIPFATPELVAYYSHEKQKSRGFFGTKGYACDEARIAHYRQLAGPNWAEYKRSQRKEKLLVFLERLAKDFELTENSVDYSPYFNEAEIPGELDKRWAHYFTGEETQEIIGFVDSLNSEALSNSVQLFLRDYRFNEIAHASNRLDF